MATLRDDVSSTVGGAALFILYGVALSTLGGVEIRFLCRGLLHRMATRFW